MTLKAEIREVLEEKMGFVGVRRSEAEWARIVEEYKGSGMTLRAWAKAHGINEKTLSNHTRGNHRKKRPQAEKRSLKEWAALIGEQISSGLGVSEWCRGKGISAKAMREAERRMRAEHESSPRQGWADVQTLPGTALRTEALQGAGQMTVRFSGIEIEADGAYPPENIEYLIGRLHRS